MGNFSHYAAESFAGRRLRANALFSLLIISGAFLVPPSFAAFDGPCAISSNQRYFLDGNGEPCFWQGDTQWDLFAEFNTDNAATLLETRKSQGFNAFQVMMLGLGGVTKANYYSQTPLTNNDPATPNEAYFRLVDSIVDAAGQKGLTLVIGVYHKNGQYSNYITSSSARAWGEWVGQRYKDAPNIIWSMYPSADNAYLTIMRELSTGLQEGDSGKHLVTVHPDPAPASSSYWQDEGWIAFNTLQTWSSDYSNYQLTRADYRKTPVKPALNGEARYETEGGTTALDCRHSGYWSYMAGGYYSYGHGGNWMSPRDWETWMNSSGAAQMKVMGDIFRSLQWWKLVSDSSIIAGAANQNVAARSSDGDWLLLYLPAAGDVTVNMNRITVSGQVEAAWIDPRTGDSTLIGAYDNSGTRQFTAPAGWDDAVLLCKTGVSTRVRPAVAEILSEKPTTAFFDLRGRMMSQGLNFKCAAARNLPGAVSGKPPASMGHGIYCIQGRFSKKTETRTLTAVE